MTTLDTTAPLRFGRFLLEPSRRLLCLDGEAVSLSSRAFDLLVLLIENRDRVVSKDEIFATVWRGVAVEDNNLAVQMSALRRALADPAGDPQTILTIPGRGYRFVAPVAGGAAEVAAVFVPPVVAQGPVVVAEAAAVVAPRRRRLWPVLGAAVLGISVFGWFLRTQLREPVAPRLSIVVLPFRNLSADPQQDYLADAISDDLTTDLSHIPGSVVIARESADVYKGKAVGAEVIGRALHVRYLLEGSLMPEKEVLHVNAQLIDAINGAHVWASRFDIPRDEIRQARDQIASKIAGALNIAIVDVEAARSMTERPTNPDSLDLYLRARSVISHGETLSSVAQAQSLLEQSLQKDPKFSEGLSTLGLLLLHKISGFDDPSEQEDFAQATSVISKALSLSPESPSAITAKGQLASLNRNCDEAVPLFRKALTLDASQVVALKGIVVCDLHLGLMQDMIDEATKLVRSNPASNGTSSRQELIGLGYLMLGRPSEAIDWLNLAGAGAVDAPASEVALGWQEWRQVYLVAATWISGNRVGASKLYTQYSRNWPHRSVWQLSSYDTRAVSKLVGYAAYKSALIAAGMPPVIGENSDFGVAPTTTPHTGSDMDPTPVAIPGGTRIDAIGLHDMLLHHPDLVIIDYGRGASVIPSGHWMWSDGFLSDEMRVFSQDAFTSAVRHDRPIVVMGNGPLGWESYNKALQLISRGVKNVLWFRGGEEGWAAAGFAAEDQRNP